MRRSTARCANDEGMRLTFLKIGPTSELNVFEIAGNDEASRQVPMFGRGGLDHLGTPGRVARSVRHDS